MDGEEATAVFPQGVASGDPQPDGIVLWTRLAPPADGGAVRAEWQVATEPTFRIPALAGATETGQDRDYTCKVTLTAPELQPFTTYYYRWIFAGTSSRVGRFKTLPSPYANLERLRLGYLSCQDFTNGYYNALGYLAQEELDYVVHLGDYIYETISEASFQGGGPPDRQIPTLPGGNPRAETLDDYRFLYQTYKSDERLQHLHERFAMINIWDDHEFANDCYREFDADTDDEAANFDPQRRSDANRAWAEYIPAAVPYEPEKGSLDELRIYRSFRFGTLAELALTDERLYRDGPPCGLDTFDKVATPGCPEREDPDRTMLGPTQRQWFLNQMTTSPSVWKLWGNETMMMQFKLVNIVASLRRRADPTPDPPLEPDVEVFANLDQWDGYPVERAAILSALRGVDNLVVITGDLHSFVAGYLRENFDDPGEPPSGVCFMAGSVTASNFVEVITRGLGSEVPSVEDFTAAVVGSNPHLEFFNSDTHGYNLLEITREQLTCTMKAVDTIDSTASVLATLGAFTVPEGQALIVPAGRRA